MITRGDTQYPGILSSKLQSNGHHVHYLAAGSGYPVILLHGGASDSRDWLETLTALSGSYSLYAPDMIGFGLSDSPKDSYYLSDFVTFALGFIQELGFGSQVLVGHSFGGRVCLEIALTYPELVRRLVLIDTVGFSRLAWWGMSLGALIYGARKVLRIRQPYPRYVRMADEDRDWLCTSRLSGLGVPTLIIWNRRDPYYPVSGAFTARELIPDSRLEVFPGFGHAPHIRQVDEFNRLLLDFLGNERA